MRNRIATAAQRVVTGVRDFIGRGARRRNAASVLASRTSGS